MPSPLEVPNTMATRQGNKFDIYNLSFQELLGRPLNPYQGNITFPPGYYQTGERTANTQNNTTSNGNDVTQVSLWKYSIGEPPDLPHLDGNEGQSTPSVTHYDSPVTNNCHTHHGIGITPRRSRTKQTKSRGCLQRYPCPISSCSRNRANQKRFLRSDNLGDHLRKVHKVVIPPRTRIMSWVRTNLSLLGEIDKHEIQVLHGGSLQ